MDLKTRLSNARQKLLRRSSHTSTSARSIASTAGSDTGRRGSSLRKSVSMTKLPAVSSESVLAEETEPERQMSKSEMLPRPTRGSFGTTELSTKTDGSSTSRERPSPDTTTTDSAVSTPSPAIVRTANPQLTLEEPTPIPVPVNPDGLVRRPATLDPTAEPAIDLNDEASGLRPSPARTASKPTPPGVIRRQSLVATSNARIIRTLLDTDIPQAAIGTGPPTASEYFTGAPTFNANMLHRKIWVKRPNQSATLVQIREDDLVDDVRDMILRKYGNSLGKTFDSPDLTLRIHPRDSTSKTGDRLLGPEEEMCRTLDAYYPGGQTVHEALLIEVPPKRTPKPSPRIPVYYSHHDDHARAPPAGYDHASEYFPPMPAAMPSPAALSTATHTSAQRGGHAISVLQTGQLPPLPSPGGTRRAHFARPRNLRHNTASPTTLTGHMPNSAHSTRPEQRQRHDSSASETKHSTSSGNPAIPTPPVPTDAIVHQNSSPPTPRVASPRPNKKGKKAKAVDHPSLPSGLLDNSVPPINVLIVEDNIINLRVLGAFMQRLKVRWQRAMNGKEAVTKWRAGGFHLVLMDIQLPIMNGLEATKEIRRLERVNSIGVFSSGSSEAPNHKPIEEGKEINADDKLGDKNLFKSPVIIVALTASSLQSDRHEALAAGCNDFLTKPVNFVWLERKVKEWGCMQALIDFDGWRKWKDFAAAQSDDKNSNKASTSYSSYATRPKPNASPTSATSSAALRSNTPPAVNGVLSTSQQLDEEKKRKRRSQAFVRPPSLPEEDSTPPEDGEDS